MLISVEVGEAKTFCRLKTSSGIFASSMKSHAWRASLAEEIAGGVGLYSHTPPPCISTTSCLVRYVLDLPGLLCPEGTMWFFILHKEHLIIRFWVFFPPAKFQVA